MLMDLRVEAPELEPSPVLLEQLSQLSQHSVATMPPGGPRTMRALMAAASVTVLAGVSWLTGTMPGVASPFSRGPEHGHAQHAPAEPSSGAAEQSAVPYLPETPPPTVPPGQAKPHHNKGNHTGQTKPHQNNGNHTGQTKPHQNNGNHTGQTKPHQNNGNHTGQTKPHHGTQGQSTETDPAPTDDDLGHDPVNGNGGGHGGGQGNGQGSAGTSQGNGHGT